jgi:hypothetical protein
VWTVGADGVDDQGKRGDDVRIEVERIGAGMMLRVWSWPNAPLGNLSMLRPPPATPPPVDPLSP